MRAIRTLFFWLMLGAAGLGCRLASAQVVMEAGPFRLANPRRPRANLPIQIQRNLLVVSAQLNGCGPYNFLLDTGVANSILTSARLADSLGLHHGQNFRVVGAGGNDTGLIAYQADSVRVTLPGIIAPNMSWLVLSDDLLDLSGFVGMPIHGIMGSELFRSFVVALHIEASNIVLTPPASYKAPRGRHWATLPLILQNNKAYIMAPVQLNDTLSMPLKLVLDTGASHALSLELDSDQQLVAPAKRLPADLGRGLSGLVRGFIGRVTTLQLGQFSLHSVLTSFPDAGQVHSRIDVPRNGNIGYELLKRFSVVIDYPHQRMLLRPNTRFREPFEHDMCGIDLLAFGPDYRYYKVLRVMPDSPAALAGLQVDDQLMSINFQPTTEFSLTELSRMMHSQDGRTLLMVLRRANGELFTTVVRLKRQI